ncbi:hypothetical protein Y1Q_0006552 [Alligator mississippiensis]|uniref:Uncharacterized protein n=1 Tax=Alligator mississippiensis TaxID=8496 RepID=A0A151MR57_ALLMI|nr:hypothetical protein Y1Q_0006552 [Alligator mississippiensis]
MFGFLLNHLKLSKQQLRILGDEVYKGTVQRPGGDKASTAARSRDPSSTKLQHIQVNAAMAAYLGRFGSIWFFCAEFLNRRGLGSATKPSGVSRIPGIECKVQRRLRNCRGTPKIKMFFDVINERFE